MVMALSQLHDWSTAAGREQPSLALNFPPAPTPLQRKLQEQQAELRAAMSKSPDRWLRAAAAEGLSLREAAVLASPGKTARPHYDPTSAPAAAAGRVAPGAAAAMRLSTATPGAGRFDAFEAGAEPYSARLHTVERQRPAAVQRPAVAASPAPAPAAPAAAAEPPLLARGGGLDFARLASDRDAYLQVSF